MACVPKHRRSSHNVQVTSVARYVPRRSRYWRQVLGIGNKSIALLSWTKDRTSSNWKSNNKFSGFQAAGMKLFGVIFRLGGLIAKAISSSAERELLVA